MWNTCITDVSILTSEQINIISDNTSSQFYLPLYYHMWFPVKLSHRCLGAFSALISSVKSFASVTHWNVHNKNCV